MGRSGKPSCKLQRGNQTGRIGSASSSNIEGGAMIRRSEHERETERHIPRMVECKRLNRDERLIVIHAQSGIVARPRRPMKHRIGGERTLCVDAVADKRSDSRSDYKPIFLARRARVP